MLCFAYGSNMSLARLRVRAPSAEFVAIGRLIAHRLAFHKVGWKDGSAKCDAQFTGSPDDEVLGVVYEIARVDKPRLDKAEGLGRGYDQKQVDIATERERLNVQIYFATAIDPFLKPYHWYKQHVLIGARENGLPSDYVARIAAVESIEDPAPRRRARELGIYA
ncbi:AIG2-like family protein [Thioflavicoccus mobilis 8321]|uniref:AIG2-like family protein n=1 Tax=Thioflavicoccus mobilis 8321 TaxID=765912 RepID=L0GZK9_9GAMM|nr:gamma-glutamylcyclotransferase family protein [Thioflavicoccus mobilis]AGA92188.1 AIG2-like family protein [Thioflavicoccus mobilis 8321]